MSTSREDISRWYDEGAQKGASHMIVAADTYDHENYPVFVSSWSKLAGELQALRLQNMTKIMEVYRLTGGKDAQLSQPRAWDVEWHESFKGLQP
jgi:hypothetical protein